MQSMVTSLTQYGMALNLATVGHGRGEFRKSPR